MGQVPGAVRPRGTLCGLSTPAWLDASELRIGLGCMRLSTEPERDESLASQTIAAAAQAGVTVFDTARAYARDQAELGHNERLLARALKQAGATERARIVTKGGMTRAGGGWVPDGRAKAIAADCRASLTALHGLPIDLYLVHAPDPRTPWTTSVRALGRLLDQGLVRRVGLSNVNRHQLDQALELAPISAVEVALSVFDDRAVRGGLLERCDELGLALIAHSPLGGPRRAGAVGRRAEVAEAAAMLGASPAEVALAWLLELSPAVIPIPGARRPETARSAALAGRLALGRQALASLHRTLPREPASRPRHRSTPRDPAAPPRPRPAPAAAEIVLIMGIPGAGKTRLAADYGERGYLRLNRDERGGGLRALAEELEHRLDSGVTRVVLDNTYLTRAARSYVIEAAARHAIPVRCVWPDTPLAQAQINLVERLLELRGGLPTPEELRALARREPGALAPTSQMRALRELEPPSVDEGFATVEVTPFERTPPTDRGGGGTFVAVAALQRAGWERAVAAGDASAPHLLFDWRPEGRVHDLDADLVRLRATASGPAEAAICPHGGGPPSCWCRPPLPGLALAFARAHSIDPARSRLIGASNAHRTLARALGASYVDV